MGNTYNCCSPNKATGPTIQIKVEVTNTVVKAAKLRVEFAKPCVILFFNPLSPAL